MKSSYGKVAKIYRFGLLSNCNIRQRNNRIRSASVNEMHPVPNVNTAIVGPDHCPDFQELLLALSY